MKTALITLTGIIFLTATALAGTKISDTVTASRYAKPDTYVIPINVKIKSWDEGKILTTLSILDEKIRNLKLPYEGGNYRVEENRIWDTTKKRYVTEGYIGTIHYTFKLKNVQKQNEIFTLLNEESKQLGFQYTVGSPHWEVSQSKRQKVISELKKALIRKSLKEAKEFGRELNEVCTVESISFNPFSQPIFPLYRSNVKTLSAPVPARTFQRISVKANVKFSCYKRGGKR